MEAAEDPGRYMSPLEMALMHGVKAALDPLGIMNPGKLLATSLADAPAWR